MKMKYTKLIGSKKSFCPRTPKLPPLALFRVYCRLHISAFRCVLWKKYVFSGYMQCNFPFTLLRENVAIASA